MSSSSTLLSSSASYMDRFGYHLAEKLLRGNDNDQSPLSFPPTNATPKDPSFHSPTSYYRANWRSEAVERSHDLFSPIRPHDDVAAASPNEPSSETQTIFVDATFDFVCLPPPSIGTSDMRVLHTAVRIGALLATKTGYRYLRGDPLAADDLRRHCRQIDVDFEHTPVATLAEMLARSFRRARPFAWRVVPSPLDSEQDEVRRWEITVCHSGELEGEVSTLPLCLCLGKKECQGEVVPRSLLDVILLQNGNSGEGNACVRLSREEGRSFWKDGKEEGRCDDVGLEYAIGSSSKEDTSAMPSQPLPLTEQTSPPTSGVHVRTERRPDRNKGTRMAMTRRPNRGQETVMYAQGIKTTIAGSKKKKKAKFTLGSL